MFAKKMTTAAIAVCALTLGGTATAEIHDMAWNLNGMDFDLFESGNVEDQGDGNNVWSNNGEYEEILGSPFTLHNYNCNSYISQGDGGGAESFIDANFEVTNTSNSTQTFSLLMTLAVGAHGPAIEKNGSVGVTVTNNAISGDATLSAPDSGSIYRAFTDLVDPFSDIPAGTLMDDPFSLNVAGPFQSAADDANFGATPGDAVANTISIMFEFDLSAGDSASISGLFRIVAVPAPGAFALLGLAGLSGRRRRRN